MRRLLLSAALLFTVSGCYIQEPEPLSRETNRGDCRSSKRTGCLAGQVVVAPFVYLEGKEYFDADDLGRKFREIVEVQTESGDTLTTRDYDIQIVPEITNENFTRDFQVYVKGEKVIHTRANESGAFRVNNLEEGDYTVRVQKKFSMKLSHKANGTAAAAEEKTFCFVIYAEDSGLQLLPGEKQYRSLDNFRLQMLDQECKSDSRDARITL